MGLKIVLQFFSLLLLAAEGYNLRSAGDLKCDNKAGIDCKTDTSCFLDPSNYDFIKEKDGAYSIIVKNCIPRLNGVNAVGDPLSVGYIAVSDCKSSCVRNTESNFDDVLYVTKVFKPTASDSSESGESDEDGSEAKSADCVDLCIYTFDNLYSSTTPELSEFASNEKKCVTKEQQRCKMCKQKIRLCRPTAPPSLIPTLNPTFLPTTLPTDGPTAHPTEHPTAHPSAHPTEYPTIHPTEHPTATPTAHPTEHPTANPTAHPTEHPTAHPTVLPTVNPTSPPESRINRPWLWLTFDSASGNQLTNSGYFNPGTTPRLMNGATLDTTDKVRGAASLKLTASLSQYVDVGSLPTSPSNGMSFAGYFKASGTATWGRLFDFGDGQANKNIFLAVFLNDLVWSAFNSQNIEYKGHDIYFAVNDNKWRYFVWTMSTNGRWKLYIDGELVYVQSMIYPPSTSRSNNFIGRSNWADPYFNGNLDDFRIYDFTLTDAQVTELYNSI